MTDVRQILRLRRTRALLVLCLTTITMVVVIRTNAAQPKPTRAAESKRTSAAQPKPSGDAQVQTDPARQALELEKLALEIAALRAQRSDAAQARADLERRKLVLEIAALEWQQWLNWMSAVLGLLAAAIGAVATVWIAQRTRVGALDQSVHEKRLETYPTFVNATAPLAIYFPDYAPGNASIRPEECVQMGQAMSKWYFGGGGLLLSAEARDAYLILARALTRASRATKLNTPAFPKDAEDISWTKLKDYRQSLPIRADSAGVEAWRFGEEVAEGASPEQRFKDYVFLQRLGSTLRTALTVDLRSRRRPSG